MMVEEGGGKEKQESEEGYDAPERQEKREAVTKEEQ